MYNFQDALAGVPFDRNAMDDDTDFMTICLKSEQAANQALFYSTLTLDNAGITRCMKSASRKGFDPRNSFDAYARCASRALADKARRSK